ncbi:transposase [Ensifer canadensis]|nr:transposase [Ensifer canadensis]
MVGRKPRFSEEEKLSMLVRMHNGENVSRLADELGIHRQRLYAWREQLRTCGNLTPARQGRPKKQPPPEAPPDPQTLAASFAVSAEQRRADALAKARRLPVERTTSKGSRVSTCSLRHLANASRAFINRVVCKEMVIVEVEKLDVLVGSRSDVFRNKIRRLLVSTIRPCGERGARHSGGAIKDWEVTENLIAAALRAFPERPRGLGL